MIISDNLFKLILNHEGCVQFPYDDKTGKRVVAKVGKVTCGIGFNLEDTGFSFEESKAVLTIRLTRLINQLINDLLLFSNLDEVRQAVLIDMSYNMGIEKLLGFSNSISYLSKSDYVNTAEEMKKSLWATEVQPSRVNDMYSMMTTGEWPAHVIGT